MTKIRCTCGCEFEPVPEPKHRLLVGDCRKPEDVARACGGEKINVAFTSPPYASQRKYDESSGFVPIKPDEYVAWWEPVQANVRKHLAADGSFFVNIKPHCEDGERVLYVFDLVLKMKRGWGWRFVDEFCWLNRSVPRVVDYRFPNGFEPVFHFAVSKTEVNREQVKVPAAEGTVKRVQSGLNEPTGRKFSATGSGQNRDIVRWAKEFDGTVFPCNVVDVAHECGNVGHSAAFPVGLPSFFIRAFSDEGDVILDPFAGSFTTLISCQNLGRRFVGVEISAGYCAVGLQRYADAFGDQDIRRADP